MENNEESTPELDLDSPSPPAQTSPTAYAGNGDLEPTNVTVPSGVAVTDDGGAIASIDDRGGLLSSSGGGDLVKKRRGRPRKYDSDGNLRSMTAPPAQPQEGGFTLWSRTTTSSFKECSSSAKRDRGRPKFDLASFGELFASTTGGDFTPHVIIVNTGEDVAGKILAFAQNGYQGISVLSATGSVSNVTLRQPGSYGGLLTHEGQFEILTLTGSFTISESNGIKSRNGGLSVSLAGPDGCVIGGGVAGLLVAANPIQVVIGSFITNAYTTQKRSINNETTRSAHMIPTPSFTVLNGTTTTTPSSQAPIESNIYPMPISQFHGEVNKCLSGENEPKSAASNDTTGDWNCSQIPYPDINISVSADDEE